MCRAFPHDYNRFRLSGVSGTPVGIFAETYRKKKDKPYQTSDKTCRLHYFHWLGKRTVKPRKLASYTSVSLACKPKPSYQLELACIGPRQHYVVHSVLGGVRLASKQHHPSGCSQPE